MNLRVASVIALVMFLGAQGLPAYRGFGGIVIGWQLTGELFSIGWGFATHPAAIYSTLSAPDSFGSTVLIVSWSGIAANLALVAAMCLALLQRTVPAFIASAFAAAIAVMLLIVLTRDGALDLKVGCWVWTASILWLFAAAALRLRLERRRHIEHAPPG